MFAAYSSLGVSICLSLPIVAVLFIGLWRLAEAKNRRDSRWDFYIEGKS